MKRICQILGFFIAAVLSAAIMTGDLQAAVSKLSAIASGGAYNPATDKVIGVRSGTTDQQFSLSGSIFQTPWTQNINGGGFNLTNVGNIIPVSNTSNLGASDTNWSNVFTGTIYTDGIGSFSGFGITFSAPALDMNGSALDMGGGNINNTASLSTGNIKNVGGDMIVDIAGQAIYGTDGEYATWNSSTFSFLTATDFGSSDIRATGGLFHFVNAFDLAGNSMSNVGDITLAYGGNIHFGSGGGGGIDGANNIYANYMNANAFQGGTFTGDGSGLNNIAYDNLIGRPINSNGDWAENLYTNGNILYFGPGSDSIYDTNNFISIVPYLRILYSSNGVAVQNYSGTPDTGVNLSYDVSGNTYLGGNLYMLSAGKILANNVLDVDVGNRQLIANDGSTIVIDYSSANGPSFGGAGHIASTGSPPGVVSCGTGSPTVSGTDTKGVITTGTAATACTLNFNTSFASAPVCVMSTNSTASVGDISSVGTGSVVFGLSVALTGGKIYYHCIQ